MSIPYYPQCAVCKKTGILLTCSICNVVQYCSESHQSEHLSKHKNTCALITRCKTSHERATSTLSTFERWWDQETNQAKCLYDSEVRYENGRQKHPEVDAYVQSGHGYISDLMRVETYAGTVVAFDKTMELLKAQGRDVWDVHHYLSVQYLRLGCIQSVYDMARGGILRSSEPRMQYEQFESLPSYGIFEPIANFIEPVDHSIQQGEGPHTRPGFTGVNSQPLSELAAIVLAKFRVMQDLRLMIDMADPSNTTYSFLDRLPAEVSGLIRAHIPETDIARSSRVQAHSDWDSLYTLLDEQCGGIMSYVYHGRLYKSFWYLLARIKEPQYSKLAQKFRPMDRSEITSCFWRWHDDPRSLKMLRDRVEYLDLIPQVVREEIEAESNPGELL